MDLRLKKLVQNHIVAVTFALPNILINLTIQSVLDIGFGWTGWLSILAWMIGGGASLSFGVFLSMLIKSNFIVAGRRWNYAEEKA